MAGAKYSPGFDDPSARPFAVALRRAVLFATVTVAIAAVLAITFWVRPSLWEELRLLLAGAGVRV